MLEKVQLLSQSASSLQLALNMESLAVEVRVCSTADNTD